MNRVGRFPIVSPLAPFPLFFKCFFILSYLIEMSTMSSVDPLLLTFPEISISSLNCNSLNMSTFSSVHQKQKIYAITKLKSDFILLSDIRLGKWN